MTPMHWLILAAIVYAAGNVLALAFCFAAGESERDRERDEARMDGSELMETAHDRMRQMGLEK